MGATDPHWYRVFNIEAQTIRVGYSVCILCADDNTSRATYGSITYAYTKAIVAQVTLFFHGQGRTTMREASTANIAALCQYGTPQAQ